MQTKGCKKKNSLCRFLTYISIGVVIMAIALFISVSVDMTAAQHTLRTTTAYIKERCNRYARTELASETKSLMRITESCEQVARDLAAAGGLSSPEAMETYTQENYLSGVVLLDAEGKILAQYYTEGAMPQTLAEVLTSPPLLDTAEHPQKRYVLRTHCTDGSELDISAAAREDAEGIVVAYYHTSAKYKDSFGLSIASLLTGYRMENGGTVVVSNGEKIVACNDESLLGVATADLPVLQKIKTSPGEDRLIHAKDESLLGCYGLLDRGRNVYVYGYVPASGVFYNTPWTLLFTFVAYIMILIGIGMVRWKTAQRYREEQLSAQKQYAAELQSKNEELHAAVERADRAAAAKTGFLSRMSHDIRTPLNGIVGLLEINSAHPNDTALVSANREKMRVAADHLLSLINDVLQMSKLESGSVTLAHEPLDLSRLLRDVSAIVESRAAEAGVTMTEDDRSDPMTIAWVYGSPLHLRQIFLNIYSNCIKYNKKGGRITTCVRCLESDGKHIIYRWEIADTGIGMSEEFLHRIFDPFAQANSDARSIYQGTGLGMTIVKKLLDCMNGTIEVRSKEGEGSVFTITIPFEIAEKKESDSSAEASEEMSIRGVRLLLAEDNELNAEIAVTLLTDAGAEVTTVTDGQQVVDLFRRCPPGTFDAILMDIMMPVLDGIGAAEEIRKSDRPDAGTIPIIAMTANAFEEDAQKCFAAGMSAHLPKPLDMRKLIRTIRQFTDRKA